MNFPKFILNDENIEAQKEMVIKIVEENRKKLKELLKIKKKNYNNFVKPIEIMQERVGFYFSPISHLNYVKNSSITQKVYDELLPILSLYNSELTQNEEIYKAFKAILNGNLTQEERRVVENFIKDFELNGVGLESEKKEELKEINIKLDQLGSTFAQNLLKATDSFEMVVDESDVKEMPKSDKDAAKIEEGRYKFTLKQPSYIAFMTYGNSREKREELYRAYVTRAPENEEIIEKILALRDKKAKILGFNSYAELSLVKKMALTPKQVIDFLLELAKKSRPQAKREFEKLSEFAKNLGFKEHLEAYDIAYFSQKLKETQFDIKEEDYKPYFEKNQVVEGLFKFLKRLFKLEFKEVDTPVWDESVKCYEVSLPHRLVGRVYLDLEAREGKRGGAWMDEWIAHYIDEDGKKIYPVAFIVANFAPSTKEQPSFLRHDDVVTLFHEMGHALHHLLSEVKEPSISGIAGVEWDAVEFPSQFLENFAYEERVLRDFAKHYQTDEILPLDMIKKLKEAKNFQSAMAMVRQLEFGLFDMKIHLKYPVDVQEILDEVRREVSVIKPPKYNRFQWSFSHIFAGGYAAGYYSYKWAEVLSADAFFMFVDNGIYNDEIAQSYLKEILCKGGSKDAMENFKAFAKKEPQSDALLKLCGIK